jgi:predicted dehydrogenase
MTDPTRIAVMGAAGWAGSRHVEAFHALGARVVALVDPSPHVCIAARAVGAEVLDSPAGLNADEVDLLRRGLRVLVEKPIGSSSANAAALGEIANVEHALMVGYTLHHHPVAKVVADWVASASVISMSIRSAARKSSIEGWRAAADQGGVAVVNGIHGIEYAASLFPGEATVHSTYQSDQLHRASVADYTAATLTFQDGPLCRLETYWNPWNHTTGLNRNDWSFEMDVIAQEGRRMWSNWSLHAWDRLGSETVHHFPEVDLFGEQAKKALRFAGGEQPVVGYRQALRATQIADDLLSKGRERL